MSDQKNHLIVILCGGTGPRLWPLSRADHPKQFLKIFSSNSLLKETVLRAKKIVDSDHLFIVSNHRYAGLVKKDLGDLVRPQNILLEPAKKNTAAAIFFTLTRLQPQYPHAVVSFWPADHYIPTLSKFAADIHRCFSLATDSDHLVAIGIPATNPNPAFGYLLPAKKSGPYYPVRRFVEKPSPAAALKLIVHGARWNSGIYTAKITTFIAEFKHYQPRLYHLFQKLVDHPPDPAQVNRIYRQTPSIPFDQAISEKTKNLVFLPASFVWSDIGEWQSVFAQLPKVKNEFAVFNPDTKFLEFQSRRCLVSAPPTKLIGLVGVNNLAVIDTPDALLVCNLAYNHSFHVRDLVAKITADPKLIKYFSPDET